MTSITSIGVILANAFSARAARRRPATEVPVRALLLVLLMLVGLTSSGCELIGDIFQAGMWTGIIIIVLIVVVIGFLVGKMRG